MKALAILLAFALVVAVAGVWHAAAQNGRLQSRVAELERSDRTQWGALSRGLARILYARPIDADDLARALAAERHARRTDFADLADADARTDAALLALLPALEAAAREWWTACIEDARWQPALTPDGPTLWRMLDAECEGLP